MRRTQVDPESTSANARPTCALAVSRVDTPTAERDVEAAGGCDLPPGAVASAVAEPAPTGFFDFDRTDVCYFDDLVALLGKPRSTVYRWLQQRALVLDRTQMRVLGAASSVDAAPAGAILVVPEWGGVREAGAPHWTFRASYIDAYRTKGFAHVMAALEAFHRAIRAIGEAAGPRRR